MNHLIRLYPRRWRERYGEEFIDVIAALGDHRSRAGVTWDICRGALDAHLYGRYGMRRYFTDLAVRRGVYDGLIIAALSAVLIIITNVVLPQGPNESDSDPEYLIQSLVLLAIISAMFVAVGARGRRRAHGPSAGVRAGSAAGALLAACVTLTFIVVNNLFLSTVSQQHDKRINFAASGWTSIRAYLTITQLKGALILIPVTAIAGALLGLLGALLFAPKSGATTT